MAIIGDEHHQLLVGPHLGIGHGKPLALGVGPGLQDKFSGHR